jgi:hypothetical protein
MGEFKEISSLSNNSEKKDSLDFLKKTILENPNRFIGGAIDKILNDEKTLGEDFPGEDRFTFDVLKYLFPTKESYWTDAELISETKKLLLERKIPLKTNGSKIAKFTGSSTSHLEEWEKRKEAEEDEKNGK